MAQALADLDDGTFTELVLSQPGTVAVAFLMRSLRSSRELEACLQRLSLDFDDRATLARVEIASFPSLSRLYRIEVIPTVLIYYDGAEIGRLEGVRPAHHYSIAIESGLHADAVVHSGRWT